MPHARYLRTSEHEEAVRSLEWAEIQARELARDHYAWKWVLIALHNAAQGFMVLALWDGNGLQAMKPKVAAKWLQAYEKGTPFPPEKLDDFLGLYAKVKDPHCFHVIGAGPFIPSEGHDRSMEQLNAIQNTFIHFTPKGWSLELGGLPRICLDTLDVLHFLGLESTAVLWHQPAHRARAERAIKRLRKTLTHFGTSGSRHFGVTALRGQALNLNP